ncbi:MAG: cytochrome c3 family protein [Candidatus Paceibacterota bacterium]
MASNEQQPDPQLDDDDRFHFPRWANYFFPAMLILVIGVLTYIPFVGTLAISPDTRAVGYEPEQPIPFSHALHVGKLQMDCRYCHSTVETAAFAAVPPTQTCLNCHATIKSESPLIEPVNKSFETGEPISWIKVHDVPDFVYFNHSAHVNKGVACESCHGRVDQMEEVSQAKSLSMAWCLECHRAPEEHLRPRDAVTAMGWDALAATGKSQQDLGAKLVSEYHVQSPHFMTSCSICHR